MVQKKYFIYFKKIMSSKSSGLGKGGKGLSGARRRRIVLRGNIQGLTKPAIKRLVHRAGVTRVSALIYEEIRGITSVYLKDLIHRMVVFVKAERMSTIKMRHLEGALAAKHEYLGAGVSKAYNPSLKACPSGKRREAVPKKRRAKPGAAAVRSIKLQQKQGDCLSFAKLSFSRLVRELLQDHDTYRGDTNWRIGESVLLMIQLTVENYLVDLFKDAYLISLEAGRNTLQRKDLYVALKIRG